MRPAKYWLNKSGLNKHPEGGWFCIIRYSHEPVYVQFQLNLVWSMYG